MAAEFKRLLKINIRVRDLDAAVAQLERAMGAQRIAGPGGGGGGPIRAVQLRLADTIIEFITPSGPQSPLARVLEQRGEGVDSIAFEVEDLPATVRALEASGVQLVAQEKMGIGGDTAAFVHPRGNFGVMLELMPPGH